MQVQTLTGIFRHSMRNIPREDAFRYKVNGEWVSVSSAEYEAAVLETATGLLVHGVQPGDRIALLSENRLEWAIADLAILLAGCIVVPVYPTLLPDQIEYILKDCSPVALFCSSEAQAAKVVPCLERIESLQHIVSFEAVERSAVMPMDKLRELGRVNLDARRDEIENRAMEVKPDDLATIIYTSGTTGHPKGVMLTHGNITSNVHAAGEMLEVDSSDVCLSFLPLSHILERMAGQYFMIYKGVTICYAESVEQVAPNMVECRPTIMISVPRLYEKIYGRVLDAASQGGGLKRKLFFWAKGVGNEWTQCIVEDRPVGPGLAIKRKIADGLVFKKLRARTGGRLKFFISGGAPLAKEIAEFFYSAGLPIYEGYGLTESSPLITVNTPERFRPGSVGPPAGGVEVRIADDGEILAKGPNIMPGYWNRPADTADTLIDGWLHTGDIGHLDDDGFLFITDRKKDILVTAGGKNVAPQPVENEIKLSKYVSEAVLIGDRRRYLTALIAPSLEPLENFAKNQGIDPGDKAAMVADPRVQEIFNQLVMDTNSRLASFEQIKYFRVLDHEFTIDDGQLTPSMKVKRRVVGEMYQEVIDSMYSE